MTQNVPNLEFYTNSDPEDFHIFDPLLHSNVSTIKGKTILKRHITIYYSFLV